jgi:NAD+ kinase
MSPAPNAFHTVAIVGRYNSPSIAAPLKRLAEFLTGRGLTVILEAETARAAPLPAYAAVSAEEIGPAADLVIVLGGDGTMLSIARQLAPHDVPIIGINQGRLGFLTDVALSDMEVVLADMLAGQYSEEKRILLASEIVQDDTVLHRALALNDVVLSRGESGAMLDCDVSIDGQFVYAMRADGLIVTTPTGSTAYALAAQGPILHPQVEAFALVPVAPHALTNRPIVVSDQCEIVIKLLRGPETGLHFDGQSTFQLHEGDAIRLRRAPHRVRLLHPRSYDYFSMLRQKLHWSETPDKLYPHF